MVSKTFGTVHFSEFLLATFLRQMDAKKAVCKLSVLNVLQCLSVSFCSLENSQATGGLRMVGCCQAALAPLSGTHKS